jgi:hypothetical protein
MASLAEIREKLKALDNKRAGKSNNTNKDNTSYPFWNIPEGETAVVRFLPDKNEDNTFFWTERQLIKIPFRGIKGGDENKKIVIQVPCIEMWGETCPIHQEIRPWFSTDLDATARTYWKKRSYIFQGFVEEDPMHEKDLPENPIRKFIISPQVFNIIKAALVDPEMEGNPTDLLNGTNFRIAKSSKGGYADYSTSKWAKRETALTEEQLEAINKYGLYDLSEFLPKKPTSEELNAQFEMFEASVEGDLYDPERWAKFYKPYGLDYKAPATNAGTDKGTTYSTPKVSTPTDDSIPFDMDSTDSDSDDAIVVTPPANASTTGKSAQDILDMIRNRK